MNDTEVCGVVARAVVPGQPVLVRLESGETRELEASSVTLRQVVAVEEWHQHRRPPTARRTSSSLARCRSSTSRCRSAWPAACSPAQTRCWPCGKDDVTCTGNSARRTRSVLEALELVPELCVSGAGLRRCGFTEDARVFCFTPASLHAAVEAAAE